MKSRSSDHRQDRPYAAQGKHVLPVGIWAIGFVSLFINVSSKPIHSLLPVFMVTTLGASRTAIGVIEGIAEAAAAVTKVFSGTIKSSINHMQDTMGFSTEIEAAYTSFCLMFGLGAHSAAKPEEGGFARAGIARRNFELTKPWLSRQEF